MGDSISVIIFLLYGTAVELQDLMSFFRLTPAARRIRVRLMQYLDMLAYFSIIKAYLLLQDQ